MRFAGPARWNASEFDRYEKTGGEQETAAAVAVMVEDMVQTSV